MIPTKILKTILQNLDDKKVSSKLSYSTDSRTYTDESLFFALKGESFDAFSRVSDDLLSKVKIVIFQDLSENNILCEKYKIKYPDVQFVGVENVLHLLQSVAKAYRKHWGGTVVAITGSNGKTTTKEMLGHILSDVLGKDKVYFTKGNFNNHFGVPFSLLEIEQEHEIAIIEMGTNHFGEIDVLCDIASPDIGFISNIGDSHLEFFKDREGVFKEKSNLYRCVKESTSNKKLFLVNTFDDLLESLANEDFTVTAGKIGNDYQIEIGVGGVRVTSNCYRVELVNNSIIGDHNFQNLASAFILSMEILGDNNYYEIISAAESFVPTLNRSSLIKVDGVSIFLDAYNANPSSMKLSLKGFIKYIHDLGMAQSSVALIIGAMKELGDNSFASHKDVYDLVQEYGEVKCFFVGNEFQGIVEDKNDLYENVASLKKVFEIKKNVYDALFIKGSRSLQLESLLDIYSS